MTRGRGSKNLKILWTSYKYRPLGGCSGPNEERPADSGGGRAAVEAAAVEGEVAMKPTWLPGI